MRIVAARFPSLGVAQAVLADLGRCGLRGEDAAVRLLGSTDYRDPPGSPAILAGRFWSQEVPKVVELITRRGGEVMLDEDERSGPWPLLS